MFASTSLTYALGGEKELITKKSVPNLNSEQNQTLKKHQISKILVIGDSISAAFGIDKSKGWVALMNDELGSQVSVFNASISGDTTSGGRHRLKKALFEQQPNLVIIELGGNDGLRGTPVRLIKNNLKVMIDMSLASGAEVVLTGMQIPPNYGQKYTQAFKQMYADLAKETGILLVPFLMDGIAGVEGMMQEDGIHPTEAAQSLMKEAVLRVIRPLF